MISVRVWLEIKAVGCFVNSQPKFEKFVLNDETTLRMLLTNDFKLYGST